MALPFDLRVFASYSDADETLGRSASRSDRPSAHADRPSRRVHVPPSIVDGVRARDVDAFRELARIAYVPLVRFAATIVGTREAAEDVVQDVFTMVWERAERWQPTGDPAAYLFTSVRNHALNEVRRDKRSMRRALTAQEQATDELPSVSTIDTDPLHSAIDAETARHRAALIERVLATFSERQRTAYDLRYRRGLTASAIAEVLGIAPKSAEQLVSRVTHLMWRRVQELMAEDE